MPTAIIGGVAGSVLLVLIVVGGIIVALRRRRHTFKGDYSTKKHVYGNGYSKAGIPQHHPPMAQNLQYPDDSDDEKKAGPLGGSSYEEEEEEEGGGGGERKVGGPHPKYDEDAKRPYFTVDEAEARQDGYGDRTLGYQYDPEQLDLAENMVSQNDGSFISKKSKGWLSWQLILSHSVKNLSSVKLVFIKTKIVFCWPHFKYPYKN